MRLQKYEGRENNMTDKKVQGVKVTRMLHWTLVITLFSVRLY